MLVLLGCREPLAHDLSESQANRVLAGLHTEAIDARKERQVDGRFALTVPRTQLISAIERAKALRLLPDLAPETSARGGLVPDRNLQRQHYEQNLSRNIEFTL